MYQVCCAADCDASLALFPTIREQSCPPGVKPPAGNFTCGLPTAKAFPHKVLREGRPAELTEGSALAASRTSTVLRLATRESGDSIDRMFWSVLEIFK